MPIHAITRRELIGGSAAALAAAAEAPKTLRWGVIGTGSRSRMHFPAIRSFPEMDIVAACDVDAGRLKTGVERIGRPVPAFSEYAQLLAHPNVNAVLVTTPNLFHEEMVLAALAAGKHVLCEKPLATTLRSAEAVRKAAEGAKQTVLFGLQLRYAHRYGDLVKTVRSGRIGTPKYVSLIEFRGDWNRNNVWLYRDPKTGKEMNWRFSQAASGGTLNEKYCHYFDIVNWIMGSVPRRILATGGLNHYPMRETWDHATVSLEYPGGARASHELCMYGPHRLELQVIGDDGSLRVMEDHLLLEKTGAGVGEKIPLTPEVGHGERGPAGRAIESAVVRMYADFLESVKTGKKPSVTPEIAAASSKLAFLSERSAFLGRAVGWDQPL